MLLESLEITELLTENCGQFVLINDLIQQGHRRKSALTLAKNLLNSGEKAIISPNVAKRSAFVEMILREVVQDEAFDLFRTNDEQQILASFEHYCRKWLHLKI